MHELPVVEADAAEVAHVPVERRQVVGEVWRCDQGGKGVLIAAGDQRGGRRPGTGDQAVEGRAAGLGLHALERDLGLGQAHLLDGRRRRRLVSNG